jgi:hypothetical protein
MSLTIVAATEVSLTWNRYGAFSQQDGAHGHRAPEAASVLYINLKLRDFLMRTMLVGLLVSALAAPGHMTAQQLPLRPVERGLYLTIFRSPATGIELRSGNVAAYAGFYPTVIKLDGQLSNTNFVRAGATYYMNDRGAGLYVSPSLLWSLDPDWKNGALTEIGFRGRLYRRLNGRIGAALLSTPDRHGRVNPTVGLDLPLGAGR